MSAKHKHRPKGKIIATHTPGPWFVGKDVLFNRILIWDENDDPLAQTTVVERSGVQTITLPEAAANARLIAAAPDLLAAALAAKQFLIKDLEEPGRTVFWQLVGALKKAGVSFTAEDVK